ncbi:MAG: hypothetical protein J2P25_13965 [Nocardiopsaceae bacterium]|nr:hypothetical protein [Nocardiopsaceae bacterium]
MAELAGRPLGELSRRDVGIALLSVPADGALASLPGLRRALLAAGNPLSAPFWSSAEAILRKIIDHEATVGDVHGWLEATGTEPTAIIGLHVWEEPANRSQLQQEMHALLVRHLEERLAAGEIDPDKLAGGDAEARQAYLAIQDRWMTTALPDGRVPMNVLLDEQDEAFLADWEAAETEALDALRALLSSAGERPLPKPDLEAAAAKLRADIARPGWPGQMLISFSGRNSETLPADDAELWLTLSASVASPQGDPMSEEDKEFARAMEWVEDEDDLAFGDAAGSSGDPADEEPDEMSAAMAAVCALDHEDWLAVMTALVTGGPGTPASAADLARYVRDYEPTDPGEQDKPGDDADPGEDPVGSPGDPGDEEAYGDFDELSIEGLFLHVTAMWSVLGAIDDDDRLTPLGWWGLPEAMRRAWSG